MLNVVQSALVECIVEATERKGIYKLGIVGAQRDKIVDAVEKRGIVSKEIGKYSGRNVMLFAVARKG
jgi:UTP-glucose-1-phosphate uridylyltransferase